jgi:hypothetical protein
MYTGGDVSAIIKPVALCVALLCGTLPAAAMTCQLLCRDDGLDGRAAHQHHSHGTSIGSDNSSGQMAGGSTLQAIHLQCDHSSTLEVGVTSPAFKIWAPSARDLTDAEFLVGTTRSMVNSAYTTSPSPPGSGSILLSLRI